MKLILTMALMVAWSVGIAYVMGMAGFSSYPHNPLWSFGAAVVLLIGLVGNVWIFFLIMKNRPWLWHVDKQ